MFHSLDHIKKKNSNNLPSWWVLEISKKKDLTDQRHSRSIPQPNLGVSSGEYKGESFPSCRGFENPSWKINDDDFYCENSTWRKHTVRCNLPIMQKTGRSMENVRKSGLNQTPAWYVAQYLAQRGCQIIVKILY